MMDQASNAIGATARECGSCHVCCIVPSIKELGKASGVACHHLGSGGCSIHASKPAACGEFLCAWRLTPEIPEDWRPDKVGLLGISGGGILFIPFRDVLGNSMVRRGLRRLVSMMDVWVGRPSNRVHLNRLVDRNAWRSLSRFQLAG